jgi:hypothetical protein
MSTPAANTVLESTEIDPDGVCIVGRQKFSNRDTHTPTIVVDGEALSLDESTLTWAIYTTFYAHIGGPAHHNLDSSVGDLLPLLQSSNVGRTGVSQGWIVERVNPDMSVIARRRDVRRVFKPAEFRLVSPERVSAAAGDTIAVYFAHEQVNLQPAYYFAVNLLREDIWDQSRLVRFYWNIEPEGAAQLTKEISERFWKVGAPFRFKILRATQLFQRRDTGVLVVPERYYQISAHLVENIYQRVSAHMRTEVPNFTKHLEHGLAFAEDPGNGESFGINRSRLLSQAIWAAHRRGAHDLTTRIEAFHERLERAGYSTEHLYLIRSRVDKYVYPV